ncbi:hypothetical protein ACX9R5_03430 [Rathayibacter sp. CAU 1779]
MTKSPSFPYPSITLQDAGAALVVLLTVSIALQALLRLPRDPDRLTPEDAVAHRQFWGGFSSIVATAAAYIALCTFVNGFVTTVSESALDVKGLFGVPLGAVVALLLTSDAAAITQQEARVLRLADAYREKGIAALRIAADRVSGHRSTRPRQRFIWWSCGTGVSAVTLAALAAWSLVPDSNAAFIFASIAVISTATAVIVLPEAATAVLRGKALDLIMLTILPAMMVLIFAVQLIGYALPLVVERDQPWAYVPAIGFGLLLFVPVVLVPASLSLPRLWGDRSAPLLDLARKKLEDEADRLRKKETGPRDLETWEVFARAAVWVSPVPIVALPLAAAAALHRTHAEDNNRKWLRAAWICPSVLALVEIAALLLLPVYAVALGWVSAR